MTEQQEAIGMQEPIITLAQFEKDLLGITPEQGDIPLSSAGLVIDLARQSRNNYLGSAVENPPTNPGYYYKRYDLPFKNRNGAALTTALIARISELALLAEADRMELQKVSDD